MFGRIIVDVMNVILKIELITDNVVPKAFFTIKLMNLITYFFIFTCEIRLYRMHNIAEIRLLPRMNKDGKWSGRKT